MTINTSNTKWDEVWLRGPDGRECSHTFGGLGLPYHEGQTIEILSAQTGSAEGSLLLIVANRSSDRWITYTDNLVNLLHKPWRGTLRVVLTGAALIAFPIYVQDRYMDHRKEVLSRLDREMNINRFKAGWTRSPELRALSVERDNIYTADTPRTTLDRLNYSGWAWLLFLAVLIHAIFRRNHPKHLQELREYVKSLNAARCG